MKPQKRPLIALNVDVSQPDSDNPRREISHHLRDPYVQAIVDAGGAPLLIPATEHPIVVSSILDAVSGVLLVGGDDYPPELWGEQIHEKTVLCHPRRTAGDLLLARAVDARRLPVLGICGGIQLMALAAGGALLQHLETTDRHRCTKDGTLGRHDIRMAADSQLARILGATSTNVNTSHHQALNPARIGGGLKTVAWSTEDDVVEAVETSEPETRGFRIGVQWHPERDLENPQSRLLFEAFGEACWRFSADRREKQPKGD